MKKLLALLLTLVLLATAFVGCGNKDNPPYNDPDQPPSSSNGDSTTDGNETVGGDGTTEGDETTDGDETVGGDETTDNGNTPSTEGKATITLLGATFDDGKTSKTFNVGDRVSVNAPDKAGETFIAWKDSSDNYLERLNEYVFLATNDITLTAEYVTNMSDGELRFDTDDGQVYYVAGVGTWKGNTLTIPSTYNGKPVTKIGVDALKGNTEIVNLILPDSITEIASEAFSNCSYLKNVTLSKNIVNVYYNAFDNCSFVTTLYYNVTSEEASIPKFESIRNLVIGESVTSIDCSGCHLLKNVVLPSSVEHLGLGGTAIEAIELHEGLKTVGLSGCVNLKEVTLPESIEAFGLSGCTSLKTIIVPHNVKEEFSFSGCTNLETVEIKADIKQLPTGCFENCTSLKKVTLPDTLTDIYESAFKNCTSLESIKLPQRVSNIGPLAFENCSSLKSLVIPSSVTSLRDYHIFYGCSSLKEITLPVSVVEVYEDSFAGCTIETVNYVGTQTEWQAAYISHCFPNATVNYKANTDYDFDGGLRYTSMGDGTCYVDVIPTVTKTEYTILKQSPSGDKVVEMVDGIFADREDITAVTILAELTSISNNAFYNCHNLHSITIPNTVKTIGYNAFKSCYSIENIVIPDSVEVIGNQAFAYTDFSTIVLGKGVKAIYAEAFLGASDGSETFSITIPKSVTYIEYRIVESGIVYYDGTKEEWNTLVSQVFEWNACYPYVVHCSDGDIAAE